MVILMIKYQTFWEDFRMHTYSSKTLEHIVNKNEEKLKEQKKQNDRDGKDF